MLKCSIAMVGSLTTPSTGPSKAATPAFSEWLSCPVLPVLRKLSTLRRARAAAEEESPNWGTLRVLWKLATLGKARVAVEEESPNFATLHVLRKLATLGKVRVAVEKKPKFQLQSICSQSPVSQYSFFSTAVSPQSGCWLLQLLRRLLPPFSVCRQSPLETAVSERVKKMSTLRKVRVAVEEESPNLATPPVLRKLSTLRKVRVAVQKQSWNLATLPMLRKLSTLRKARVAV